MKKIETTAVFENLPMILRSHAQVHNYIHIKSVICYRFLQEINK